MYRILLLTAILLGGCSFDVPGNVRFDLDTKTNFNIHTDLANIKSPPTPQQDILIILHDMSFMSLAVWSRMDNHPASYFDPMLPNMLYITSKKSTWKLEVGLPRTNVRNFVLKPGKFRFFPKDRALSLQWPDETRLYDPSPSR